MGWADYAKALRACERRARAEHLSGKAKAPRQWWVWLYNYEPGNPDRRIKGLAGPYATRDEAESKAAAERDVWFPRVMPREPTAAEQKWKRPKRRRRR